LSVDELGVELPDLDTAYLEAFQAAQEMWGELLAEKSDPLLRCFEITDVNGRLLLTLPFGEVLQRARKSRRALPNEVKSARALLQKTRSLAASLHEEIKNAHRMIENAHRSMEQTQAVLGRLASRNE